MSEPGRLPRSLDDPEWDNWTDEDLTSPILEPDVTMTWFRELTRRWNRMRGRKPFMSWRSTPWGLIRATVVPTGDGSDRIEWTIGWVRNEKDLLKFREASCRSEKVSGALIGVVTVMAGVLPFFLSGQNFLSRFLIFLIGSLVADGLILFLHSRHRNRCVSRQLDGGSGQLSVLHIDDDENGLGTAVLTILRLGARGSGISEMLTHLNRLVDDDPDGLMM